MAAFERGVRAFRVPADGDGERLDRVLARCLDGLSRQRCRELIEAGAVRVEQREVRRPAQAVTAGWRIDVRLEPRAAPPSEVREDEDAAAEPELVILHEDEHIVVVDKPAGLLVHSSNQKRAATLGVLLARRYGELPDLQGADRPGIVHRLDAQTSGVLVVARTPAAGEELLRQFRQREIEKNYLALVHGVPRFDSDWIESPIARSSKSPERMVVVEPGAGRSAETFYEVLERFEGLALLRCSPRTGRTHQIRVHLASIGHTVAGDRLYRERRTLALPAQAPPLERHALHASRIAFRHPASGARLEVEAPLPLDMARLLEWLRARAAGSP